MKVRLKALEGTHRGREIRIPIPQCIVGRGDACDLRAVSPAVSRRHCTILVLGGSVIVHDFHSKNGTFLNGERIEQDRALKSGDKLQIGPLGFEIVIDHSLGGEKKAKVKNAKETAEREVLGNPDGSTIDENDVSDWLDEADQVDRERRLLHPENREFRLEQVSEASLQNADQHSTNVQANQKEETKRMASHTIPGKLPPLARPVAKDSGEAAAAALRGFFGRR